MKNERRGSSACLGRGRLSLDSRRGPSACLSRGRLSQDFPLGPSACLYFIRISDIFMIPNPKEFLYTHDSLKDFLYTCMYS